MAGPSQVAKITSMTIFKKTSILLKKKQQLMLSHNLKQYALTFQLPFYCHDYLNNIVRRITVNLLGNVHSSGHLQ